MIQKIDQNVQLLKRLKSGCVLAFHDLYNAHRQNIYHLVRSRINKSYDVEDIVQDVFMKIWEYKENIEENKAPIGLLYRITLNKVCNYKIHEDVKKRYNDYLHGITELNYASSYSIIFHNELETKIESLLAELSPVQRDIFLMSWEKGLSRQQIAQDRGLSVRTIDNQIYRTKKKLKEKLSEVSF
ncbi:sigma-70 family RNA polymerase sigma factor [Sunxiuqinia sp. A32]|uniref:sigma-70 family RNA polymerase sigma factor n=1 Tax=Sunxiuqinia sp. A32 TaxID=3461496 RepID=UPI00404623A1